MMTKDRVSKALSLIQYIKTLETDRARLHAENAKLREALEMVDAQVSCADVRMDKGPRYRFMTSGQHDVIMAVKATLGTVDANQGVEPSPTAADRATGGGRERG